MRAKGFGYPGDGSNRCPAGVPQVLRNIVENTPCAETVAAAAMLALLNTTNAVRCRVQDPWWRAPWCLTSSAEVVTGEQQRQGGRGRMREGEDGNNRGGRQQQCLSSSNQVAIRKHKKAQKTHNNQPPKWRQRARLVAGKGTNVSRPTGVGLAWDEATGVEQRACKRGGGDERHPQC
jgi:hypothetical protein